MKIVLSRKGFDSSYGGYPSPILPNDDIISLPIPNQKDKIKYNDLQLDSKRTYYDLMKQLKSTIKYNNKQHTLTKDTRCHLDPDLDPSTIKRPKSWKPLFGQIGGAQTHLWNQNIKKDDLFLFFGTFKRVERTDEGYRFISSDSFHAIYGYLQIGEMMRVNKPLKIPKWMEYHPHTDERILGDKNTLFVARDRLSWNQNLPGAQVFAFDKELILTKDVYSKSRWNLPYFFKNLEISYHSQDSWKDEYFKSASKGQEFVIEEDKKVENWAKNIIKIGVR